MNDCPFCDYKGGFSQELAYHLNSAHAGLHHPLGGGGIYGTVWCWCGQGPLGVHAAPFDALSQFAVHLQRHGGATAHWLAHGLGLEIKT